MATYSSNTTLKMSAGVSAQVTVGTGTSNAYTGPATGYAIIQAFMSTTSAGTITVRVDGRVVFLATAPAVFTTTPLSGIYVGPSQVVSVQNTTGTTVWEFSGVAFVNTP